MKQRRTYLEKPRTAVGWRGLISDPTLTGSEDMARGLALGRRVLLDILAAGLPTAVEFLDPLVAILGKKVGIWYDMMIWRISILKSFQDVEVVAVMLLYLKVWQLDVHLSSVGSVVYTWLHKIDT